MEIGHVARREPAVLSVQTPTEPVLLVLGFLVIGFGIDSCVPREPEAVSRAQIKVGSIRPVRFCRTVGMLEYLFVCMYVYMRTIYAYTCIHMYMHTY
jgi:hypothetical protein